MAYWMGWKTRDLVWSLWLGSLTLGYLTILSIVGAAAWMGLHFLRQKTGTKKQWSIAIVIGLGAGLFFLGFFSFHFCAFHAGDSVFLAIFFPLEGMPEGGFGSAFMNPPRLWYLAFEHLLKPYGLFLIPAIIAERRQVFFPLYRAWQALRTGDTSVNIFTGEKSSEADSVRSSLGTAMMRPYLNVIRMHLLIFFFAGCWLLKIDNFLIYAVVFSVYFFPWSELKKQRPGKTPAANPEGMVP
jgi:hypothetical protein